MEFHLREKDTEYALRGDYLSQYQKYSPGKYLDYNVIRSLCGDENTRTYDMCGDANPYKIKWSKNTRKFFRILWIKNPVIRVLYGAKQLYLRKRN